MIDIFTKTGYNKNIEGATGKRSAPENILVKNNRAYWGVGGYFFVFLLLLPNIYPKLNIAMAKLIIEIKLSVVSIQHHPLSLKVGGRKPSAEGTNRIPFVVTPWKIL